MSPCDKSLVVLAVMFCICSFPADEHPAAIHHKNGTSGGVSLHRYQHSGSNNLLLLLLLLVLMVIVLCISGTSLPPCRSPGALATVALRTSATAHAVSHHHHYHSQESPASKAHHRNRNVYDGDVNDNRVPDRRVATATRPDAD